MRLMTVRGHQEESEAAGKWRRALLTSAQLSTYYVGHQEVSAIVRDLKAEQPTHSVRQVHDTVLAHGSPSPACSACSSSSSPARTTAGRVGPGAPTRVRLGSGPSFPS